MLTTVEKVLFLMRAPATAEVSTDALSRLAAAAYDVELQRGERLYNVGDDPQALFLILDGAVRVEADGAPPRLAEAGDVVGALPLFAGGPHPGTATALAITRLLRVERADLHELLDEDGEFARALFSGVVRALHAHLPSAAESV